MGWLDNMILRSKLILLTVVMLMGIAFLAYQGFSGAAQWMDDVTRIGKEASVRQANAIRMDRERLIKNSDFKFVRVSRGCKCQLSLYKSFGR